MNCQPSATLNFIKIKLRRSLNIFELSPHTIPCQRTHVLQTATANARPLSSHSIYLLITDHREPSVTTSATAASVASKQESSHKVIATATAAADSSWTKTGEIRATEAKSFESREAKDARKIRYV